MENKTYFIVQYNDCYNNGAGKMFECIVKRKIDFKKWLKIHNSQRKKLGELLELAEEFDLIPVQLFDNL
mgnify:CR=1 FL=1